MSTLLQIVAPAAEQAALAEEATDATSALEAVRALPCETAADAALLNEIFVDVRARIKNLKEKRATLLGPVDALKKAITALFAPALAPLETIEQEIRDRAEKRGLAQAQAELKLEAENKAALLAGRPAVDPATLAVVPISALSLTYEWEYQIEDFPQVPREFLMVDPKKVKDFLKPYKKSNVVPAVPGLSWARACGSRAKAG